MTSLIEGKEPNAECEYRKQEWEKAVKSLMTFRQRIQIMQ